MNNDSWKTDGLSYLLANTSLTVAMPDGSNKTVNKSETKRFNDVITAIREGRWEDVVTLLDIKTSVENFGRKPDGKKKFEVRDGVVYVNDETLPSALSNRIVEFVREALPHEPLLLFWENLKKNPSFRAVNDLYAFLEHNKHPITPDGCFIAYRGVTIDWKDQHTKKMDNSIGATVEMPRNKVNENPNETCSAGLHVAGFDYAHTSYGSGCGGHTVAVKVNPADVVAIPVDYANAKMRVCKFVIVQEIEQHLNDRPLYNDEDEEDEPDEVCGTDNRDCLPERDVDKLMDEYEYGDKDDECDECGCVDCCCDVTGVVDDDDDTGADDGPDEALFQGAMTRYDSGDYAGAQVLFDQLVAEYPGSGRHDNAGYLAGRCRYRQGYYGSCQCRKDDGLD